MVRVLIAGLVAMVIAIVIGPTFIEWLRRSGVGQQIREEGPARHIVKQGTPTMGGLLILATALVPFILLSVYTRPGLTLFAMTLGCAAIGFADDYLKVRKRRSLGLNGRWKMLGLVLITIGVGWVVTQVGYLDTEIYFPVVDVNIDLGIFYFPFLFVVIAGTANGVNLTDGSTASRPGRARSRCSRSSRSRRSRGFALAMSACAATTTSTSRSSRQP